MCFYHFTLLPDRLPHFLPHHLPTLCPLLFVLWTTHQIQFVLPIHSLLWGHLLECGQPTKGHTLKGNGLFLSQKLSTVNSCSVGRGGSWAPPQSVLDVDWLDLEWFFCREPGQLLAREQSASITSRRHCFVWILPNIQLLESFRPIFHNGPWALGEAYDIDVQFVAGNSAGTVWGLCWLCVYRDMTVEGSLIVCLFDRAVVGFFLGPMSSSALVLGQICSTRLMFPFVEQV